MSEAAVERQDVGPRAAARGTRFQNLAASLLVYRLTHSTSLLGVVTFSQFIPILILGPCAGALLALPGRAMVAFAICPRLVVALVPLFFAGFGYLASNTAATARLQLGVRESQVRSRR